jgi:hypothetical protein
MSVISRAGLRLPCWIRKYDSRISPNAIIAAPRLETRVKVSILLEPLAVREGLEASTLALLMPELAGRLLLRLHFLVAWPRASDSVYRVKDRQKRLGFQPVNGRLLFKPQRPQEDRLTFSQEGGDALTAFPTRGGKRNGTRLSRHLRFEAGNRTL